MIDGTYSIDGYEFGTADHDVVILSGGFDPGAAAVRSEDADNPVGDGRLLGRDYYSGVTLTFTFGVRRLDETTPVWDVVAALSRAWRPEAVRRTPGAESILTFQRAGTTYRLRGRGRNLAVKPSDNADDEWQQIEATFDTTQPVAEIVSDDGGQSSLTLGLIAAPSGGGLRLPAVLPWSLRPASQGRQGVVSVGGVVPATFTLTLKGPAVGSLTGAVVSGSGWEIGVTVPITYGQTVVIDTATQTIKRNGVSIPGYVTRKTRLNARLSPGTQTISFTGSDPSNTATASLAWRSTVPL